MNWKKRHSELVQLKLKYKKQKYKVPFPDLKVEQKTSELSNVIAVPGSNTTVKFRTTTIPDGYIIGNSHKQGLTLMPLKEAEWAGGKKT